MALLKHLSIFSALLAYISAQVVPQIDNSKASIVRSKFWPGASISYQETFICETTPDIRAFAGYINLPSTLLAPLEIAPNNISTFFWYFQSRQDPANDPLAIWVSGGPGESTLDGTTLQNGPCYVNPDGKTTTLNEWSFNNVANVLYLDQPSTVGYSYQTLINGTLDQLNQSTVTAGIDGVEPGNLTLQIGTFPNQDEQYIVNSTVTAARIFWHVVQEFTAEFPEYQTADDRVSLLTNSYGGYWGPAFFDHFVQQNVLLAQQNPVPSSAYGQIPSSEPTESCSDNIPSPTPVNVDPADSIVGAHPLNLDTLGFSNGCVDLLAQALSWATFAVNNTYGVKLIDDPTYVQAVQNITSPGGCQDLIQQCQNQGLALDTLDFGTNEDVNQICAEAENCMSAIIFGNQNSFEGRSVFDVSQNTPSPYPPAYNYAYFNSLPVQEALGVPLNWSNPSIAVQNAMFIGTGDAARQTYAHLQRVLDAGIKVAMVYGDLDHRCNWFGAENVSLTVPYANSEQFNAAGYTPIVPSDGGPAPGVVRQFGGFSFSRVFQAGHDVGTYKPQAMLEIIARTMADKDVATGQIDITQGEYSTTGPADSRDVQRTGNSTLPASKPLECNIWAVPETCTDAQIGAIMDGSAVVEGIIVTSPAA